MHRCSRGRGGRRKQERPACGLLERPVSSLQTRVSDGLTTWFVAVVSCLLSSSRPHPVYLFEAHAVTSHQRRIMLHPSAQLPAALAVSGPLRLFDSSTRILSSKRPTSRIPSSGSAQHATSRGRFKAQIPAV